MILKAFGFQSPTSHTLLENAMSMGKRLRTILDRKGVTIAPGAIDVLSCLLFQEIGYEMIWAGGFMSSASQIGWADANVLTLTEHATYVRNIRLATNLPILVDIDNGYGGAVNVIRTIREMEQAGAAGVMLEDQVIPKRCALFPGSRPIISKEEMIGKLKAALDARTDESFVIAARTDSFGAGLSVNEAIDRASAYVETGVDAILPISKKWENLERFATTAKLKVPLITAPTLFPQITTAHLDTVGFKIMIQPLIAAQVALKAMKEAMTTVLREGTPLSLVDRALTFPELSALLRLDEVAGWEEKFVPSGTSLVGA